ncbi:Transmembrane protein [Parasponia andersonii]|uniref:Transmembrane protein n=1 Tax=Parasponia andersonii TaxID=3476 RepID=A0A2P5DEM8_PARAD|nr:Transmembrane protein [Parasponia andersonii]
MDRTFSLLYEAALEGNVTTLRKLLEQDRLILDRIIVINNNGFSETPLHVAAILVHADFVKEILNQRPELAKEVDTWGSTPLHLAAAKGHLETVKVLVSVADHEITCFSVDREGRNPIHIAAMRGRLDVLGELVRVAPGAVEVILEGRRETVLHVCVRYNQLEALRLLVEVVDVYQFVNAKDDYGMTVLHLAVADKQIQTVRFLLTNTRIEVNAVNANGFTALDILAQSRRNEKDFDISECLRASGALQSIDPPSLPQRRTKTTSGSSSSSSSSSKVPVPSQYYHKQKLPKNKKTKPENWLTRKREALMVVASLIATMAFQAVTSPPGGLWQDDSSATGSGSASQGAPASDTAADSHRAGESIMAYNQDSFWYHSYLYCNTVGFISSLSIILLLITGLPFCRKFFMWVLTVIMWVTITAIALTYTISIYIFTPKKEQNVVTHVILYLVLGWIGIMALILVLHTIRLLVKLFKKLVNLIRPRRKKFIVANGGF